jgi:flagellar biogenesis protein FliO
MANTFPLWIALLVLTCAASLRAEEGSAAGEIVRSGTAYEASPDRSNELRSSLNDREYDFRLRHSESSPATQLPKYDAEVQPAKGTSDGKVLDAPKPRQLAPRSRSDKQAAARSPLTKPTDSLITIGGSLCVVLSLFFALAWLTRRGLPKSLGKLPGEVIEVLGKAPLVKGQELQLVRVGAKLLLICVTPTGCETLTEIVDRSEVDRLSTICRTNGPSSMTAAFNQVLTGIGREPATGFAGSARTSADRRGGRVHA